MNAMSYDTPGRGVGPSVEWSRALARRDRRQVTTDTQNACSVTAADLTGADIRPCVFDSGRTDGRVVGQE